MLGRDSAAIVDGIRTLFGVGAVASTSDGQLIDRYLSGQSEAAESAFAAIVDRHGAMVLRVCRGVLRDPHQADDAFQATFLILARKAGSVRNGGSLASWLFGVARRVALRARADRARRAARERKGAAMRDDLARLDGPPESITEVQDEVARLPEKYRAPILLCYFEGLTHEEAAGQLGLPVGTVKVRLSRARDRLRGRLIRLGLAPALVVGVLSKQSTGAVPSTLAESTIRAATRVAAGQAAGVSISVAALVEGVIAAMSLARLKLLAALTMVGLTLLAASTSASPRPRPQAPATPPPEVAKGVVVVKKADFVIRTQQIGTVEAFESINLSPRFSGTLKSMNVDIGDAVKRGQVVAEIDAPELAIDAEKAIAVVGQADAKILTAKAAVLVARAALDAKTAAGEAAAESLHRAESEQKLQEKQYQRIKGLGDQKAVEQRLVEEAAVKLEMVKSAAAEARARVVVSRADLQEAKAKVEAATTAVGEAEADRNVALAGKRKADILRESTLIRSPIDGVVTFRSHVPGDFVRSSDMPNPFPIVTIVNAKKVRVVVDVPDSDVPLLDRGDLARVVFQGTPNRVFEGVISRTAFSENPATRTLRAEIDLDNAAGKIRPGQFATVVIMLDTLNCLMIPKTAVIAYGFDGAASCYRAVNGQAVLTTIKIGRTDESRHEVISGLKIGDSIFLDAGKAAPKGVISAPRLPGPPSKK